jgi:hypothetical protein
VEASWSALPPRSTKAEDERVSLDRYAAKLDDASFANALREKGGDSRRAQHASRSIRSCGLCPLDLRVEKRHKWEHVAFAE